MRGGRKVYLGSGSGTRTRARARVSRPRRAGYGAYRRYRRPVGARSGLAGAYRKVRGRGGFKEWGGTALRGLGALAGGAIGGMAGGPWGAIKGAATGSGLAGLAGSLVGLGDYKVGTNSLLGIAVGGDGAGTLPTIKNSGGKFIFQHREYICDIASSEDFLNQSFSINPGMALTFPWLASIANCFEQWRPRGIVFQFKSTSADALSSENTALGTVVLATDYNSTNDPFSNKQQMENQEYVSVTKPSCSVLHPVECAPKSSPVEVYYVRTGPLQKNSEGCCDDIHLYDLGNFQLATVGMQGVNTIGELWVSYDIELLKPKLPRADGDQIQSARFLLDYANVSASRPFGTAAPVTKFNNIPTLTVNPYDGEFTGQIQIQTPTPDAVYMATLTYQSNTNSNTWKVPSQVFPGSGNVWDYEEVFDNGMTHSAPGVAVGGTGACFTFSYAWVIDPVGTPGVISLNGDGLYPTTGIANAELFISRINGKTNGSFPSALSFRGDSEAASLLADIKELWPEIPEQTLKKHKNLPSLDVISGMLKACDLHPKHVPAIFDSIRLPMKGHEVDEFERHVKSYYNKLRAVSVKSALLESLKSPSTDSQESSKPSAPEEKKGWF